MRLLHALIFTNLMLGGAFAQTIKVQPYLQDAEPTSIYILWETSEAADTKVQWGPTPTLGNLTQGSSTVSQGTSEIHEVQLTSLERFTRYYYRAISGADTTDIFNFKTPPFAGDNESFRIIAMSDMQRDNAQPDKFEEVVNEGVLSYLESEVGGEVSDNIALLMIPGDLVKNGLSYASWQNTFFDPIKNLSSNVPIYPVPGNHENNATFFFQYFKLPENGTSGYEEHWWYKDYGNVRILGMDSNGAYRTPEQLAWLDQVLDSTCVADSIDFVFAQLHHPFKSELWTPGEEDFTGDVIERLEQFTSQCNKPSIHFFGHTHGYSRGQSRDHKHLWINAATAGGAIDLWGEWPQFDYDEFTVSQDEYGFVSVEVTGGVHPSITVKRLSRGDATTTLENELTDSTTMYKGASPVAQPTPNYPIDQELVPECVKLEASSFSSPNSSALHGQSHWQVSLDQSDFANPIAESWKNFENWYLEEDTQANDDLTDEEISGLEEGQQYWWRVRYRDQELNWSEWSDVVGFTTSSSALNPNLVLNPGAEENLNHWTTVEGIVESVTDGECDGVSPYSGNNYFAVGGLCEHSEVARCIQDIDVTQYVDSITTGSYPVHFGGALSDFGGSDIPEMKLIFLDANLNPLGESARLENATANWKIVSSMMNIPVLTHFIRVELKGTRVAGTDNDSYFDDIFVRLGSNFINCSMTSTTTDQKRPIIPLNIRPNPSSTVVHIKMNKQIGPNVIVSLIDAKGAKINCPFSVSPDSISCDVSQISPGIYTILIRNSSGVIGSSSIVVQ